MILSLYNSAREIESKEILRNKVVIFTDAFQSSPLFLTALFFGAKAIIPSPDVEMAIKVFKSSYSPKDAILIGERDYEKIEGFHYAGILLLNKEICEGKTIIYYEPWACETIFLTEEAKEVYIASFLNRTKVCEKLKEQEEVVITSVGLQGRRLSLENFLLAGSIIHQLSYKGLELNDTANVALASFRNLRRKLKPILTSTERAVALTAHKRKEEIEKSLEVDAIPLLPTFSGNRITLSEGI